MAELPEIVRGFSGRDAITRMLMYAIRVHEVATQALTRLRPDDFNAETESDFQIIWIVAHAYWDAYGVAPPAQYMYDICSSVLREQGFNEGPVHTRIHALITDIYEAEPSAWDINYGMELLRSFLGKKLTDAVQHVVTTNPGNAKRVMELIQTEYYSRTVEDAQEINPLAVDSNSLVSAPRRPLYVPQLDLLLGGGVTDSECIGVLGPSGGGKTLLAIQAAAALAFERQHCLYFTYEQPAEELRPRIISCMTRLPSSRFANKKVNELDTEAKEKLDGLKQFSQYLTVVDRSSAGDNTLEIDTRIRRAVESGNKPRLVIIDWAWILVTRIAAASGRKQTVERQHLMMVMDSFKSMASKYRVSFMILQQLSTEQAKRSPDKKPQWFNAAEAGNFAWLLPYCFAIGQADSKGVCYLVGSKARAAKKQDCMMQLKGDLNRFDLIKEDMTYKSGTGFVDSAKADSFDYTINMDARDATNKSKYESAKDIL